jgi:GAF domain-containing protein/HAMP domain-containing protein
MNRQTSIRTRLILSFLAVVFLSLSGLSLMLVVSGIRTAQQEINHQLATVANYKSKAIQEWANTLKAELGNVLVGESMQANIANLIEGSADPALRSTEIAATRTRLRTRLLGMVGRSRYFQEFFVLDPNGTVVISTIQSREGQSFAGTALIENGKDTPYIATPYYSPEQDATLLFSSYPIFDESGQLIGILGGRAKFDPVDAVFADLSGLRENSETFLLGQDGGVLTGSDITVRGKVFQELAPMLARPQSSAPSDPVVMNYTNLAGLPATGAYQSLPSLHGVLLVEQAREDILRGWAATLAVNLSVTLSSIILALFIALLATRSIASPISELAEIATRVAKTAARQETETFSPGEQPALREVDTPADRELGAEPVATLLEASQELEQRSEAWGDEIGQLAHAFDGMTLQLSGLIGSLEQKVDERTQELETRSRYLEASADVARAATSMLDPDKLLEQAVELIRDRFDLYYVGLFLSSAEGQWAVLRAGTGSAGRILLERGHKLRIEPSSMIGWCIANAQARIAQMASQDEVRFATPELPETRSEAALPLRARGQVIGAVSVQSSRSNAFDQTTIAVLQTMADQLAIAIDNALLFAQSQQALDAERRAYALSARSEWRELLRTQSITPGQGLGMRALFDPDNPQGRDLSGIVLEPLNGDRGAWYPEMHAAYQEGQNVLSDARLAIPIRVRGTVIGVVHAARSQTTAQSGTEWLTDEIAFLERVAEQLGVALDSARLYAETRQRAEQERLVDRVTSQMRATLDIETVLETAARELRDALGLAEVEVRLGDGSLGGYSDVGRTDRAQSGGENQNDR